MINLIRDVKKGRLRSAYVEAPFDVAKDKLERAGYHIISLQENARLRMQERRDSSVSKDGNWTREGVLYVPEKGVFLVRNSPIMSHAKEATEVFNRIGKEFYLTNKQVEKALADSVNLEGGAIPTNRFGEDKRSVFAFGEDARAYGEFLRDARIKEMPIFILNPSMESYVSPMWLHKPNELKSGLDGCYHYHNPTLRVRGLRDTKAVA